MSLDEGGCVGDLNTFAPAAVVCSAALSHLATAEEGGGGGREAAIKV